MNQRELRKLALKALPSAVELVSKLARGEQLPGGYRVRSGTALSAARLIYTWAEPWHDVDMSRDDKYRLEKMAEDYQEAMDEEERHREMIREAFPQLLDYLDEKGYTAGEFVELDEAQRSVVMEAVKQRMLDRAAAGRANEDLK